MRNQKKAGVISALKTAVRSHRILTISTLLCVAASVAASLIPPLLLKNIIDRLTGGMPLLFTAVLLYFGSLVLEGTLSSAQETLLVLFGQKMTHALRSEMSQKLIALPASTLVGQNPGEVAARFSGDVDAVEALFTSGIISMAADACRIISIMAVIAVKNTGIALVLLLVLPLCLQKDARQVIAGNSRSYLLKIVEKNPQLLVGFADRASDMLPFALEAFGVLMERGCFVVSQDGRLKTVPGRVRKSVTGTDESVSCQRVARIVGKEFARIADRVTVYTTFGIRP